MVHFGDLLANAESLVAKIQSADGVPPVQRGLTEIARESTMLGADGGAQTVTPARGGAAARLLAEARIDAQSKQVHRLEQLAQHDAVVASARRRHARAERRDSYLVHHVRARARSGALGRAQSRASRTARDPVRPLPARAFSLLSPLAARHVDTAAIEGAHADACAEADDASHRAELRAWAGER